MKRSPLLPPLFRAIAPKRNSYVMGYDFPDLHQHASRSWLFDDDPRCLQLVGGGYVKRLDDFAAHAQSEEQFQEFIREASQFGSFMPSSYASIFHDRFRSPRVPWSLNAIFSPQFAGAWNEARTTGAISGHYRSYDINSAYLWASTLGMPEMRSVRFTRTIQPGPGLYVLELRACNPLHPYPFNSSPRVNATSMEIEQLNLDIARVLHGVTWSDHLPGDCCTAIAQDYTFWKHISRGYWGRWASHKPVTCQLASGKSWELRNPMLNYVWACSILARVRMRLWEVSANALHFYTDSVITRDQLPVGSALGDWRQVADFPTGIEIQHAGFYRHAGESVWLKHAGVSLTA